MNQLKYRGAKGFYEKDDEGIFIGEAHINDDILLFETNDIFQVEQEFKNTIDAYFDWDETDYQNAKRDFKNFLENKSQDKKSICRVYSFVNQIEAYEQKFYPDEMENEYETVTKEKVRS